MAGESKTDLKVLGDPIRFIRKHPHMFVKRGSGEELAALVAEGSRLLTGQTATIRCEGGWWAVAGEYDWLDESWLGSMQPFPEAGANSIHPEVLLSALAEDVVTGPGTGPPEVIKGSLPPAAVWKSLASGRKWQRIVAFRLADDE